MDDRLINSSFPVVELEITEVRLARDWSYPGRCLVICNEEYRDIQDLGGEDYLRMMMEVRGVTQVLRELYKADKMNVASFGNIVAWLHWHVIPRHEGDAGWPATPWENPNPAVEADEATLAEHAERIEWALLDADFSDDDDLSDDAELSDDAKLSDQDLV
jgi:diadenosine tetraphosphate (Ap4A) HIT family hydrolase